MDLCELLNGTLKMIQPANGEGPRVNVDTVLLAHFTRPRKNENILEIGCAHGAISLILAKRGHTVSGIDIQPHLIALAEENAELNGGEVKFMTADIREYKNIAPAQSFDRIVTNPPYDEPERVKVSPSDALSAALHGSCCRLEDIITAAHYLLKNRGRLDIVMRANRLGELLALLETAKTPAKKLLCVHPNPKAEASVVLIEAIRSAGTGLKVLPPLFITDGSGKNTPELEEAYIIK